MSEHTELNPCRIHQLNPDASDLVCRGIHHYASLGKPEPIQHTNLRTIQSTYSLAVEILQAKGKERLIPNLVYCLVPKFGDSEAGLSDSKIGGIPDLRTYIVFKDDLSRLEKLWPRCGCCHTMMKFVGQFDMLPWLLPIHSAFSQPLFTSSKGEYAQVSGIGRQCMSAHASVFSDVLWHLFVCPLASQHWDIPSSDACVLITHKFRRDLDESDRIATANVWEDRVRQLAEAHPHIIRLADHANTDEAHFDISPRRIIGYDFRLEFDQAPWDDIDEWEELEEELPEIFARHPTDFTLFGEPRSQQSPRRYFSTYGLLDTGPAKPYRMTPFVPFNDEHHDMTYQIYADTVNSDGYIIYCKTDASCT